MPHRSVTAPQLTHLHWVCEYTEADNHLCQACFYQNIQGGHHSASMISWWIFNGVCVYVCVWNKRMLGKIFLFLRVAIPTLGVCVCLCDVKLFVLLFSCLCRSLKGVLGSCSNQKVDQAQLNSSSLQQLPLPAVLECTGNSAFFSTQPNAVLSENMKERLIL